MTITATPNQALTEQALTLCRTYADEYGNDTDHHEFLRLIADIWQTTGTRPKESTLEEVLSLQWLDGQVDEKNFLPDGWTPGHPEHGPAVNTFKDGNDQQISILMTQALEGEW